METSLEAARRHVASGERVVNRLEHIVNDLRHVGHDSIVAEELLNTTRALLAEMHEDIECRQRTDGRAWPG